MKPQFFDSHAHLSSPQLYSDIDGILKSAKEKYIVGVVNICTDEDTLIKGLKIREKYPWIYNAGATTPHDVDKEGQKFFEIFERHAKEGHFVAIGETGLDYFYEHSQKETQKAFLKKYLKLALDLKLPIIFHCREAFADLFSICDSAFGKEGGFPAILHCFTGTVKEAEEVIKRGWYLSLSGIVTYKKSEELRKIAKMVPLDQLLIETDSPYLAPQSLRGKINEPSFIYETAQTIAKCKNLEVLEVALASKRSAHKIFSL